MLNINCVVTQNLLKFVCLSSNFIDDVIHVQEQVYILKLILFIFSIGVFWDKCYKRYAFFEIYTFWDDPVYSNIQTVWGDI